MGMSLYDHKSAINWAYRGKMTSKQMAKVPELARIITEEAVLLGDDVIYDFRYLEDLKRAYNVEEEDPEAALALVIEAMNEPKPTPEQILADQQAQLDEQAVAIEELITMQFEGVE